MNSKDEMRLTRREREVVVLLAQGLTQPQISLRLRVSPDTVKAHVKHARAKLGATNSAHAVALAYQRGLLGANLVEWITTARRTA